MDEIKKKVEAILFSVGRFISLEEISRLCKSSQEKIKEILTELKVDYETKKDSALVVISDNDMWKLTTREEYGHIVRKIVTETELTKSQLETLAVIAFKYPIKQADLIRIRTNKAYDHLMDLEKAGYITRQKYGRSRLIKLTDRFFDYFDLPHDKLKERFKGFEQLAKAIEQKETEIEKVTEEEKKAKELEKYEAEKEKKLIEADVEIGLIDEDGKKQPLEIIDEIEKKEEPDLKDRMKVTLGGLEVVDEEDNKDKVESPSDETIEDNTDKAEPDNEENEKDTVEEPEENQDSEEKEDADEEEIVIEDKIFKEEKTISKKDSENQEKEE
jgi:segregation and condensation protein B